MKNFTLIAAMLFAMHSGAQILTQTTSDQVMADNSVACVDFSLGIRENHFFRAFPLAGLGYESYQVGTVYFGVEQAQSDLEEGLPVIIRLYATTEVFPSNFPDNYTLLAEEASSVISDNLYIYAMPIDAVIGGESTLVVEIEIPETDGSFFQLGSNNLGQSAPAYIMAPSCTLMNPTTLASAGFPEMHAVIYVDGTATLGLPGFNLAGIAMHPNPASDSVNIELPNGTVGKITVSDISGKIIAESAAGNMDVSGWANGIYLVKVSTGTGSFSSKLVKQ